MLRKKTLHGPKINFDNFSLHRDKKKIQRIWTDHKVCNQLLYMVEDMQWYKQSWETLCETIALRSHITAEEYDAI